MNYNRSGSGDLDAIKNDGTPILHAPKVGVTLPVGTYYIPLGGQDARAPSETALISTHFAWNAALAATITLEESNFPAKVGAALNGDDDVNDYDATAGNWIPDNDATGDKVQSAGGAGNVVAALTITAGGTNAGGVMAHLRDRGCRRLRWKVVVTAQGVLRAIARSKVGA